MFERLSMNEDDYFWISNIQHYVFCPRQWALIEIDGEWKENILTVTGSILHEKVHQSNRDVRSKSITVRGMRVKSDEYQIQGQCDAVEYIPDESGIYLPAYKGVYSVYPVEYKKGKSKADNSDRLQLTAQVVCLEEMLCTHISKAYLFYFETRRREEVRVSDELRRELKEMVSQMKHYRNRRHIPEVKIKPRCRSCSLNEVCLPELTRLEDASVYMKRRLKE